MKYRYFMINQIFGYEPGTDYIDFFATVGNYINPEIDIKRYIEYASDYKIIFEVSMNELIGKSISIKSQPGGQIYEIDKYDLTFISEGWQTIGRSSWTKGADGIVWTISLHGKSKSIPVKNWDEIFKFIKDNK